LEQHLVVVALERYRYGANDPIIYDDPFGYACRTRAIYGLREITSRTENWTRWMPGEGHVEMAHDVEADDEAARAERAAYAGGYARGPSLSGGADDFGPIPWFPEKCLWTRFLMATEQWRQKIAFENSCDCPPRRWISGGGYRAGTTTRRGRRQRTFSDGWSKVFGVFDIECHEPPM